MSVRPDRTMFLTHDDVLWIARGWGPPDAKGELNFSPKRNWVDKVGGLPNYIDKIAGDLHEKGMPVSRAVATAINVVKKMCATGDLNYPGKQSAAPPHHAAACAAVAEWEAKKARARAT